MSQIVRIKTIHEMHRLLNVEKPLHPLISVCRHVPDMNLQVTNVNICFDFYIISLKSDIQGSINYGRNTYDFEEGTILYSAPGQVFKVTDNAVLDLKGWTLFVHPDLFNESVFYQKIQAYNFFLYDVNEALHVSEKEKLILKEFVENIENEISQNLDRHSHDLIIHNLESVLKYSERFYDRQFLTRTNKNQDFISKFEQYLIEFFNSGDLSEKGLPTVKQCGEALNISGYYLSDLLKIETGKTAKEHIQLKLVNMAKHQLLNSNISVKSLAYELGFEYPQYFSRFFKHNTGVTPSEYRKLN
ncbi:MAG: helix-turn-helix transcriptional regulator [Flavobacteriales bacterium]|nr:helix-turn-helix transcriptional regulator [Flavobacteriales bacterium]